MTLRPTPQVPRLVTLSGLFLAAGLVFGRLELLVLAAPFLVVLTAGLLRATPEVTATLAFSADRCLEGDTVQVTVGLTATGRLDQADVHVRLPDGLALVDGAQQVTVAVAPGERREITFSVRPRRWGVHHVGPVRVVAMARRRLAVGTASFPARPLRVMPVAEPFTSSDQHPFWRALTGSHVSRGTGEGIEFAAIRPYVAGDSLRRVNWRATSRHAALHVNEQRPERNAEVVLFLDTFADAGPRGATSLDVAVRAALGIAEHYLSRMDRVGVVGFGGVMRWLPAGSGRLHQHRIAEHLLGMEAGVTYAWKDIDILPRGTLPPRALIIGLTPLLDERASTAMADLARRGHAVVVIDTAPTPLLPAPATAEAELAQRLYLLEREALLHRLAEIGVPVVPWRGEGSLDVVLTEVTRLHARPRVLRG